MTPKHLTVLAASLIVTSLAAAAPSAKKPDTPPPADPREQVVCFTEPATGSHIRKRTCMTQAERERRRQADQEAMKKFGNRKTGKSAGSTD